MAILQYSEDYDFVLPSATSTQGTADSTWVEKVDNDYRDQSFVCPGDLAPFDLRGKLLHRWHTSPATSYVWNAAYADSNDGLSSPSGQPRSRIAKPEQTILIADGSGDFLFHWELKDGISLPNDEARFKLGSIMGRHNGRPNVLFADGHVGANPVEQMFLPRHRGNKSYFAAFSIEDD